MLFGQEQLADVVSDEDKISDRSKVDPKTDIV
jgi:hypothetical protein